MLLQFAVRIADIDRQILTLDPAFVPERVEECLAIRRRRVRGAGGKESDPGARLLRVRAGRRKQSAHPDKKPPTSVQTHGNFLCKALKADPTQFSGREPDEHAGASQSRRRDAQLVPGHSSVAANPRSSNWDICAAGTALLQK
jgi:hypothetical protein